MKDGAILFEKISVPLCSTLKVVFCTPSRYIFPAIGVWKSGRISVGVLRKSGTLYLSSHRNYQVEGETLLGEAFA